MYQVLYRKWRPKTFSDVSGQDHITATLKNELKTGRLAHAYLFTGSRGTGKTSCAKILAKAVNCVHPVDGDPCNQCEICEGIENGTILDITEIDAASNNGVDNIRALREEVHFTPTAGKYRVYIIDEVHMLSVGAFNALLKTLEEPPEHVIFILATTEVHKVPATVLSRCQRFDFSRISDHAIAARLQHVAQKEGFALTADAAELIARLADGGIRDALSILDRCVGAESVDCRRVNQIVGLAGNQRLHALAGYIADGNIADALNEVEELHRSASDMARLCDQLITHFRNLMLAKAVPNPGEHIVCSPEDLQAYMNGATAFTMEQILQVLKGLQNARERMRGAVNQRVELEMALIQLTMPVTPPSQPVPQTVQSVTPVAKPTVSVEAVFPKEEKPAKTVDLPWREEQDQIRKNEDTAQKYREEVLPPFGDEDCPPEEPPVQESPKPVQSAAGPVSAETGLPYFEPWARVIEALDSTHRMMASALRGSDAYLQDGIVLIKANNPQFVDLIRLAPNREAVRKAIQAITGESYRLGPYKPTSATEQTDPLQAFVQGLQGKVTVHNLDEAQSEEKS